MKSHAQVAVIGGGLIGCSILYHLAKLGWSDVVLLERDELISGSTWHAAAGIHGLHDNYEPDGGNVDPSGVTHAYAAGLWAREVAEMAGFDLPLIPMEHQYLVTESIPQIGDFGRRLPLIADRDGEYYMRQEGLGLLVGAYEKGGRFRAENGTPMDFGHELLDEDLDRIEENLLRAFERVPVLAETGVKRVINGPMIWSPDRSALFGPVPERRNYYCCCGIIPGFSQSGGLGLMLAQWIIHGEPEKGMFPWNLARFGNWADKKLTRPRAHDQYSHRFKIHFPFEKRDAGRPLLEEPPFDPAGERLRS